MWETLLRTSTRRPRHGPVAVSVAQRPHAGIQAWRRRLETAPTMLMPAPAPRASTVNVVNHLCYTANDAALAIGQAERGGRDT
eukprot:scaffold60265_cov37-Tisochrysis_lutea.AAC.2